MLLYELDDQGLVREYLKGNESAFEVLLNRHKQRVFSHVLTLVKDRELADDIFQDTFYKVIRTLKSGKYKEEGKFLPWVMRIAHNLAIDFFRRNKKMHLLRSDDEHDVFSALAREDLNIEQSLIQEQIFCDIRNLIDLLPEEQREVVQKRMYEGLSFKEIADQSNVSINTALGRMRYALINIRKMIHEHQISLH